MSLRDIRDNLLNLRSLVYRKPPVDGDVLSRFGKVLDDLNRAIEHQDFLDARPTPKLQPPPGWSHVLVRQALPLSAAELAAGMEDIISGREPVRCTRYVDVLKVTSPSGIVTMCHDDEDRYAKLLADRDDLLAQLKAVEAARDAERLDRLGLTMRVTELQAAQHEPAPEPERAPEIIKQVELSPHRGAKVAALALRAEALGDAMLAARYGNQDGRLSREDLEELHAECLLDARIALGLERKGG